MENDKLIETLADEFKLIKGEVKQTLASVREYLVNSEMPASEYATIMQALGGGGGGGSQKMEMKGDLSLPKHKEEEKPEEVVEEVVEEVPEDEVPEDELPEDELPKDELPEERLLKDELPEDELWEDELPEEKLLKDELPEEKLRDYELPEDELPEDERLEMEPDRFRESPRPSTPPVNLMANLIRWVANAKREIGSEQLPIFLEVYGISGHLAPEMKEVIEHLADISSAPSSEANPAEIWSRLISELHGILTGGDAPIHTIKPLWSDGGSENQTSDVEAEKEDNTLIEEPPELKADGDSAGDMPLKLKLVFPNGNGKDKEFSINLTPSMEGDESSGRIPTRKKPK